MDERNVVFCVCVCVSSTIKSPLEVSGYEFKSRSVSMSLCVYLSPVSYSGGIGVLESWIYPSIWFCNTGMTMCVSSR